MKLEELSTAIIGCGNLGQALATGMLDGGINPSLITATRRNLAPLKELKRRKVNVHSDNVKAVKNSRLIILAVKPYNIDNILQEIGAYIDPEKHIIVSVITGIYLDHIAQFLPKGTPILRAMPNTAADVKQSLTCISHKHVVTKDVELVSAVFGLLGRVIVVNEELMEAATVMGACGIAYVMRFIRAMVQGGIEIGFDARTASAIVQQTVRGAAELLVQRGTHPESEIDKVTTPKGCTIVGLNEMEHHGFSSALIKGIRASYDRIEPK